MVNNNNPLFLLIWLFVVTAAICVSVPECKEHPENRRHPAGLLPAFAPQEKKIQTGEILLVTRNQYARDHHNTATLFQTQEINTGSFDPGAALKAFNPGSNTVRTIFETGEGVVRDPDVSFDGQHIVFSYRKNIEDDYHIYEINKDGSGLRQLTSGKGISDIDPIYMPDGSIVFSSTREPKYCMCNRHIMANLYRMEADGANVHQLGKSTLFEGHPAVMNDGRIIYDRWEYVDRNFGDAQGLWTTNPDGTKHSIYYGNNTNSPGGVIDPRPIPGSPLVLCIFSSCHDRPWGALALIDRSNGIDGEDAVVKIWPAEARALIGTGNWDTFMSLNVRFEDPFPLSERQFLVSRSVSLTKTGSTAVEEKMGIYLVDLDGEAQLLYEDEYSCFDPMPLAPRVEPRIMPTHRNFDDEHGFFYVQNVYEGTHMDSVPQGSIHYLRVVESPEKRTFTSAAWGGQGQQAPGMNWHSFENKRILGTVPIEEDGSVYFEVPAGKYVYFQLLDQDRKMIQSMRSGVIVHPGETNGCIGCHEDRLSAPLTAKRMPEALRKPPHKMEGWLGYTRTFSYIRDVQPVFDRHCIGCHDFDKEGAEKLVLAGDRNPYFNASYIDMHLRQAITCIGGGPAEIQHPYSWGSNASKLAQVLESGHEDVQLTDEEMDRINTWIDLNGVYYPEYESAYPDNPAGRSPLTEQQLKRLGELTGIDFGKLHHHQRKLGPQISFERPALSPCLDSVRNQPLKYEEALHIIRAGSDQLVEKPRADMDGFVPCTGHLDQLRKYTHRRNREIAVHKAIQSGEKIYD